MPLQGKVWRHIIFNTHSSWLHGAKRGFRSRDHRIHSTGDYKNPPPADEHHGLGAYHIGKSAPTTKLTTEVFSACGNAIVQNIQQRGHRLLAVSVSPTHVHMLVELPDSVEEIKTIVGWWKWFATRSIRELTDAFDDVEIWADGEGYPKVESKEHLREAHNYIVNKQGADAWTWSYKNGASW